MVLNAYRKHVYVFVCLLGRTGAAAPPQSALGVFAPWLFNFRLGQLFFENIALLPKDFFGLASFRFHFNLFPPF
jgi:hypothetical protein